MTNAPPFHVSQWLNSDRPLALADFHGRVLAVEVFQMLCPGCVSHGLPQASKILATFDPSQVAVIGLHSVFEHHDAMTPIALKAFLHEYRIGFAVGVDQAQNGGMPRTMEAWGLEGTPSLVLFDRQGRMRARHFGTVTDMALGAQIMGLLQEKPA